MPSRKIMVLALAAFTVVMMMVFFAVPSAIGVVGERLEGALQSAAKFTGTEDDVQEITDRIPTQEITQDSKNPS
jgi:biopolymer transport protein ExbB/TolQ